MFTYSYVAKVIVENQIFCMSKKAFGLFLESEGVADYEIISGESEPVWNGFRHTVIIKFKASWEHEVIEGVGYKHRNHLSDLYLQGRSPRLFWKFNQKVKEIEIIEIHELVNTGLCICDICGHELPSQEFNSMKDKIWCATCYQEEIDRVKIAMANTPDWGSHHKEDYR